MALYQPGACPMLFNIHDLDKGIEEFYMKHANNIHLVREGYIIEARNIIQNDFDRS